jgi:hypothetical protein
MPDAGSGFLCGPRFSCLRSGILDANARCGSCWITASLAYRRAIGGCWLRVPIRSTWPGLVVPKFTRRRVLCTCPRALRSAKGLFANLPLHGRRVGRTGPLGTPASARVILHGRCSVDPLGAAGFDSALLCQEPIRRCGFVRSCVTTIGRTSYSSSRTTGLRG